MQDCEREVVLIMLRMSQPAGEIALLVLVDVGQGREARRALVVLRSPRGRSRREPCRATPRSGSCLLAAPLPPLFERREQLVVDADRDGPHGAGSVPDGILTAG